VIAAADNNAEIYCQGRVSAAKGKVEQVDLKTVLPQHTADMQIGPFYGELRQGGLEYGAKFSNAREIWFGQAGSGQAVGRVAFARFGSNGHADPFDNAVLLDGCLHVFGAAFKMLAADGHQGAYVPASIQSVTLRQELPPQVYSQVTLTTNEDGRAALADIRIYNDAGQVVAEFKGLELRHTDNLTASKAAAPVAAVTPGFTGLDAKTRAELIDYLRPMAKPQRVRELSRWLTAEIKDTLGQAAEGLDLDNLPPNTAFLEIGLDSLMVTELQRRIQGKLEFRFKPMQGLDYQSIDSMAEYLHDDVLSKDLDAQPAARPAPVAEAEA
jgi:acyl carrier protein